MLHSRLKRVEELLTQELAKILNYDMRDPRIALIGVTGVKVSRDLSEAIVHVSFLEDAPEKIDGTMEALESARGYVRHLLAQRVDLKRIPEIHFKYDPTESQAFRVFGLMEEIRREEGYAAGPIDETTPDTGGDTNEDDSSS